VNIQMAEKGYVIRSAWIQCRMKDTTFEAKTKGYNFPSKRINLIVREDTLPKKWTLNMYIEWLFP
jgi:hypothetical protein